MRYQQTTLETKVARTLIVIGNIAALSLLGLHIYLA